MAEIDNVATASEEQTGTLESEELGLQAVPSEESVVKHVDNVPVGIFPDGEASDKALIPVVESGSSARTSASNVVSGSSPLPSFSQPKKFSAVNINKKFLEKNSTVSGPSQNAINSTVVKSGSPAPRPAVQASSSHSRLVTTKLTATLPTTTTTGPGWSRTASSPSPVTTTNVVPSPPVTSVSVTPTAAPQLPHAGKVIQPQPRAVASSVPTGGSQKDNFTGSNKPVWGNVRTVGNKVPKTDVKVQNDFPTAAEVAQVRTAKISDTREAAETAAAHKQARLEEADTFRGVHLDPNAHHWDEMEEDDDNFLDGVIEFGDGRQYKIPAAELPPQPSPSHEPPMPTQDDAEPSSTGAGPVNVPNVPVSKEERFVDDFDRRWPRSKTSPPLSVREFPISGPHPAPISPVPSQALQSPQESSRVLFNERSNRLEPYSNSHPPHRPGQSSFPLKRGTQSDLVSSPTESRSSRDLPPHSQAQNGVQLLQKPGNVPDFPPRPRGVNIGFGSGTSNAFATDRPRDRENYRRDDRPFSPPHPSPHGQEFKRARDHHGPFGLQPGSSSPKDRDFPGERGRRSSTMGPPAPPQPGKSKDSGRQLPPHLSQLSPASPLLTQRRMPSQDPQPRPSPTLLRGDSSSLGGASVHAGLQSPVLSQVSVASPVSDRSPQAPAVPVIDIDEMRKDVMQSAAARAKQRRQQEEEEREKEKERARRKAAELEEKIKATAAEAEKAKPNPPGQQLSRSQEKKMEEKVIQVIEEAVQDVEVQTDVASSEPSVKLASQSPKLRRPPSLKPIPRQAVDSSRPMLSRRASQTPLQTPMTSSVLATPAAQAESWRSKTVPLLPSTPRQAHVRESAPVFPPRPPTAVERVESLVALSGEELEVVDFSDLGKFVGVPDAPLVEEPLPSGFTPRSARPVASDFFDDRPLSHDPTTSSKSSLGHWRRKHSQDLTLVGEPLVTTTSAVKEHPRSEDTVVAEGSTLNDAPPVSAASATLAKGTSSVDPGTAGPTQIITVSSNPGPQRTPRAQTFYREAAMSALDDAMSRIKGALDGMQASEAPREQPQPGDLDLPLSTKPKVTPSSPHLKSSKEPRWIPPALRVQHLDSSSREVFRVTGCEPPRTPKIAWNEFIVRLPTFSNLLEPPSKRQLHPSKSLPAPARWDILSWEPQVEGMNRRDYSLNDILFPKQMHKGKHKYRVALPRLSAHPYNSVVTPGPKVNLPHPVTPKPNGVGAFGRPANANGQSTWRKPLPPKTEGVEMTSELCTVSRSPPPDLPLAPSSVTSMPNPSASVKEGHPFPVRSRSQPKMPAGSAVAFYRDSRIDTVESSSQTFVNFVFNSELEESLQLQSSTLNDMQPAVTLSSPSSGGLPAASEPIVKPDPVPSPSTHLVIDGVKPQPASPEHSIPTLGQSNADSKSSDDSTDQNPAPSAHHPNDIWTKAPLSFPIKESPARAPDPEHLKAVWSQASDKARLPAVNSLEGIADDLTALPFTLQDVKSDDGEALGQTPPPPTSMAPSRMSLHDVTRAFQQVPSSSSSSSGHRSATLSPPSTTAPLVRQPNYAYTLPPPNPNLRPSYAPYPSQIMSHTPSPTVMYTHPVAHSPVPSRMPVNGHTPIYSPPVWMPLPGPASQNHGGMMRPLTSPYPAQLMSYPSPGTPTMYAPPPANLQSPPPQQNGAQARGRGIPLMSPVMSQTGPHPNVQMYPGSPVLMHALPQGHGYMPMPPGRNDNPPIQQQSSGQPSHTGFTPVPPNSFLRTTW